LDGALRKRLALVVLVTLALMLTPAGDASAAGRGTWVLQEARSSSELRHEAHRIKKVLSHRGILGLSVRVPWSRLEPRKGVYHFAILRKARRIAGAKALAIRFMAGKWTPSFRRGNSMIYDGAVTGGLGQGAVVPLPFGRDGGPNRRFDRGWKELVIHLVRWAKHHRVHLVHLSWPGLLWSEMALTDQMMAQPGYSYRAVRRTHIRLMRFGIRRTTKRLRVEFALSGYAPSRLFGDVQTFVLSHRWRRVILQNNNLSDVHSGLPFGDAPPPLRAAQVIQPSNTYEWSSVFRNAREMYARYVEVYTPSFYGGTPDRLYRQVRRFLRP
jgi:hypothetical protein